MSMNSDPGDEDEELVPGRRVFFGMKFHDEESRTTVRKVSLASLVLGTLVVLHFMLHLIKRGKAVHGVLHLFLGLILPVIGWRGASLQEGHSWRARLLWMFHVGNVVFVLVHGVLLLVVFVQVSLLESTPVEAMCRFSHSGGSGGGGDPMLPAAHGGPRVLPKWPSKEASYEDCLRDARTEKSHAPGLMTTWALISLPYWACAAYAAYYSHELYFQIRIRELTIHRAARAEGGESHETERLATVGWAGGTPDGAVE